MHRQKISISVFTVLLVASFTFGTILPSHAIQEHDITTGLKILVYYNSTFGNSSKFADVYGKGGNEIVFTSYNYSFTKNLATDNFDAIFFEDIGDEAINSANLTAIKTWFESGQKLLWIGGSSDFASNYNSSAFANPMLSTVGSQLRMDAGEIEDSFSNDGASYRVLANGTGPSSPFVDYATNGVNTTYFYVTTSVFGWNYSSNSGIDLRSSSLPGVDVLVTSSKNAVSIDLDSSATVYDFYSSSSVSGNYPMVASEKLNGSYVIVSGKSIFSDYKDMYGELTWVTKQPHQNIKLVDNIITWIFTQDFGTHPKVRLVIEVETQSFTETRTTYVTTTEITFITATETTRITTSDLVVSTVTVVNETTVFVTESKNTTFTTTDIETSISTTTLTTSETIVSTTTNTASFMSLFILLSSLIVFSIPMRRKLKK